MGVDVTAITIVGFKIPINAWRNKKTMLKCVCGTSTTEASGYCTNCGIFMPTLIPEGVPNNLEKFVDHNKSENIMFDPTYFTDGYGYLNNDDEDYKDDWSEHNYLVKLNNHVWLFFDGDSSTDGICRIDQGHVFVGIEIQRRGVYRCEGIPVRAKFDLLEINKLQSVLEKDLLFSGIRHYDFGIWTTGEFDY